MLELPQTGEIDNQEREMSQRKNRQSSILLEPDGQWWTSIVHGDCDLWVGDTEAITVTPYWQTVQTQFKNLPVNSQVAPGIERSRRSSWRIE